MIGPPIAMRSLIADLSWKGLSKCYAGRPAPFLSSLRVALALVCVAGAPLVLKAARDVKALPVRAVVGPPLRRKLLTHQVSLRLNRDYALRNWLGSSLK